MPQILNRIFRLSPGYVATLEALLQKRFGLRLSDARELASAIRKMSDYYIENPRDATPWGERWCQIAQLVYYRPLNFLRSQAVLRAGQPFGFFEGLQGLVDFGSGLGPVAGAYHETVGPLPWAAVERSPEALALARELGLSFQTAARPSGRAGWLLSCSYSLTELQSPPPWLFEFEHLMLIEPSTRQDGRALLRLRSDLIQSGYSMWAPCPHQQSCPLLEKNPHDWCHDRIHFERPDWWLEIEQHLPFQNPTLTFSYLLASKRPRPARERQVRTVGDLMREKGKSRQMICRGPEREFFAWLARHGEPPEIPRGVLLQEPAHFQTAGNELRLSANDPLQPAEPAE